MNGRLRPHDVRRLVGCQADADMPREVRLVDVEERAAPEPPEPQLLSAEESEELHRLQEGEERRRAAEAVAKMTLSRPSLERIRTVRKALDVESDGDPYEQILDQLIAGEVGIGHELQDIEAALTALMARTVSDPAMFLQVTKMAREAFGLSSAVRRRTENTMSARASLRAQRVLLAVQRGRLGV